MNRLNYKGPEKTHATGGLGGNTTGPLNPGGGGLFGCRTTSLLLEAKWLNIFIYTNKTQMAYKNVCN